MHKRDADDFIYFTKHCRNLFATPTASTLHPLLPIENKTYHIFRNFTRKVLLVNFVITKSCNKTIFLMHYNTALFMTNRWGWQDIWIVRTTIRQIVG